MLRRELQGQHPREKPETQAEQEICATISAPAGVGTTAGTSRQKQQLCAALDAGPQAAGFQTACWSSLLVQAWIRRECGVLFNRHYVCALLKQLGYSFQKAKWVADHLDEAARAAWQRERWPDIVRAATQRNAMILFGDEASFPQWGTLSYTWARRGAASSPQPTVHSPQSTAHSPQPTAHSQHLRQTQSLQDVWRD